MRIVKVIFLYALIGCKTVDCNAQSGEMHIERYGDGSVKSTIELVNGKGEGPWTDYYPNGKRKAVRNYKNGVMSGETIKYDSLEHIEYSGAYVADKRVGEWKFYYPGSEKPRLSFMFENDKRNGVFTQYDSVVSGRIITLGSFKNDKEDGDWKQYHGNGKLKIAYRYENGVREGPLQQYDSNGAIEHVGTYVNGKYEGRFVEYYANGKEHRVLECSKGKWLTAVKYYRDGKTRKADYAFKNGMASGPYTAYDSATGMAYMKGHMGKGKMEGSWIVYFPGSERIGIEFSCKDGLKDGNVVYYDSARQNVVRRGAYNAGKIDGVWKYYRRNKLWKEVNWDTGRLSGQYSIYDSAGAVVLRYNYQNGVREGKGQAFYEGTGKLWIDGSYTQGNLNGALKCYYPSGKLRRQELYKNGVSVAGKCFSESGKEVPYYKFISAAAPSNDLNYFVNYSLVYPLEARDAKVQGDVKIGFNVSSKGEISDIEIVKGIGSGCDEEAIRIIEQMPDWYPETIDGKPVASYETYTIRFRLD